MTMVVNSSKVKVDRPMVLFKQCFTPLTSGSQKPTPTIGLFNNKIPYNLLIGQIVVTSSALITPLISLEQCLKVLALSEIMTVGTPLQLQKNLNANKNALAESPPATSKYSTRVDVHVHKQIYALLSCPSLSCTYKGPAKSMPILLNSGCSLTRSSGRSGTGGNLYDFPSNFRHTIHQ